MKAARQRQIIDIITNNKIETQDELAAALKARGYEVTQATVSRDIKELGLVKVPTEEGSYRYAMPQDQRPPNARERMRRMFLDAVTRLDSSENLIIVHTLTGTAHAVAACIDQVHWPEIIGTVAGDDTILIVVKPKDAVDKVLGEFQSLLE